MPLVDFKVRSPDVELITASALLLISLAAVKDNMLADIKLELVMLPAEVKSRFNVAVKFPELVMLAELRSRSVPEIVPELVRLTEEVR